ncbi:MAG: ParB N-terminal domain-containing protein [Planctomycetota bacterium]
MRCLCRGHLARRFGWQQPIVAKHSKVIAGNTRLKAAQGLGMTEVPVCWFDGDDLAATAHAQIADNRTHEFAEWNDAGSRPC